MRRTASLVHLACWCAGVIGVSLSESAGARLPAAAQRARSAAPWLRQRRLPSAAGLPLGCRPRGAGRETPEEGRASARKGSAHRRSEPRRRRLASGALLQRAGARHSCPFAGPAYPPGLGCGAEASRAESERDRGPRIRITLLCASCLHGAACLHGTS